MNPGLSSDQIHRVGCDPKPSAVSRGKTLLQPSLIWPSVLPVNKPSINPPAPREECLQPLVCPLSRVSAGTAVRIKRLPASPEVSHRLREMGFCEEQKIKLLARHSNVICQVCNARLGISAQLADAILVETIPSTPKSRVA